MLLHGILGLLRKVRTFEEVTFKLRSEAAADHERSRNEERLFQIEGTVL